MAHTLTAYLAVERGRLVNAAIVGGLHLGAIYTLLVALDVVPSPVVPPSPLTVTTITRQPTELPTAPVVGTGPTFRQPTLPREPTAPVIHTDESGSMPSDAGNQATVLPTVPPPVSGKTSPVRAVTSTHTIPPYPPLAMRLGYQGSVRLRISVDEHGKVIAAVIETSSGHADLDAAAVSWVEAQWRYEPAMQSGQPIAASTRAVVTFQLNSLR